MNLRTARAALCFSDESQARAQTPERTGIHRMNLVETGLAEHLEIRVDGGLPCQLSDLLPGLPEHWLITVIPDDRGNALGQHPSFTLPLLSWSTPASPSGTPIDETASHRRREQRSCSPSYQHCLHSMNLLFVKRWVKDAPMLQ